MQTNPFIRKKRCSRAKEAYGNSDFKKPPNNGRLFDTMKKENGCARYQSCQPEGRHSQNDDLRQPGHRAGRKVLLVDTDAQGSLTLSLGWEPDELPIQGQ